MEGFEEKMLELCSKKEWTILSLSESWSSPLEVEKQRFYWQPNKCPGDPFGKVLLKLDLRESKHFAIHWDHDVGKCGISLHVILFRK